MGNLFIRLILFIHFYEEIQLRRRRRRRRRCDEEIERKKKEPKKIVQAWRKSDF